MVRPPLPLIVPFTVVIAPPVEVMMPSALPNARVPPRTVLVLTVAVVPGRAVAARAPLDSVKVKPASPTVPPASSRPVMALLPVSASAPLSRTMSPVPAAAIEFT
jgi:hypothetical protein